MAGFRTRSVLAVIALAMGGVVAQEAAITTYGSRNTAAPEELSVFSFLVGKWQGVGKTRLEDGNDAEFELTWIGRYILDGMAIADEIHSAARDAAHISVSAFAISILTTGRGPSSISTYPIRFSADR